MRIIRKSCCYERINTIDNLSRELNLQIATDAYKDDLIDTLKSLLAYKEEAIDHLRGQIEELKRL